MLIKASRFYGIGLTLAAIGAIAACSSESGDLPSGSAGSTAQAGSLGTAGTTVTGTGGTPAGTAGTPAGTAGTAVTTAGTGAGGATGAGPFACAAKKPTGNLITDFTDAAAGPNAGQLAFTAPVAGGTYSYGAMMVSGADKSLHVTGKVMTYAGFGIYLNDCHDAAGAGATGVSFNIKGNVGTGGKITLKIQTNANAPYDPANKKGGCDPKGLAPADAYPNCHDATFDIPVAAAGGEVSVKWADLMAGLPVATVDGKDVVGLQWAFAWMEAGTAYDVDVTVDDIKFTGTIAGGGGSGSGGTSSGGSGGAATGGGGAGGSGGAKGGSGGTGGV